MSRRDDHYSSGADWPEQAGDQSSWDWSHVQRNPPSAATGDSSDDPFGSYQYGSDQYGSDQYGADQYGSDQYEPYQHGTAQYGTDQYGAAQYGDHQQSDPYGTQGGYRSGTGHDPPSGYPYGDQSEFRGGYRQPGAGDQLTGTEWLYQDRGPGWPMSQPTADDPVSFTPPAGGGRSAGVPPGDARYPYPAPHPVPAPPPRRTKRPMAVIGAVLVAVLLALLATDRITPVVIGHQVGSELKSQMATPSRPDIRFGGFPFLTQLGTGQFHSIEIEADDVPVSQGSKTLTVGTVDATLHDVKTSHGYSKLRIGSLDGSAKVSYAKLSSYLGLKVSAAGEPGRVKMKLGGSIVVTGVPAVDKQDQKVGLEDPEFKVAGRELPTNRLTSMLQSPFQSKLPDLGELTLDNITATEQGLVVEGSGHDIVTER